MIICSDDAKPINPDTKQRRSFVAQLHVASYPRRSYNYLHLTVRFQYKADIHWQLDN